MTTLDMVLAIFFVTPFVLFGIYFAYQAATSH